MTVDPGADQARGWQALRTVDGAELCAEGRLPRAEGGDVRLERWWVQERQDELLRLSAYGVDDTPAAEPSYLSEAELIGVLDAAWEGGVLSDFFKRQLFMLVANRFDGEPA